MKQKLQKAALVLAWFFGTVLCLKALSIRLYNADLWWHLAAGRAMVKTSSFLRADLFSHTMNGTSWINFEWLSQLVLYGIYVLGGFWGLYAVKIFVCAGVVLLLVLIARRAGATGPVFFLLSWVAFKVVQPRLQDRPELFTLVFLGILVWLVLWAREKDPAATKWLPLGIFGLMVLWVNSHGGFVYGLAFLILFAAGAAWASEPAWVRFLLVKMSAAAALALLFNPYGVRIGLVFWEHYQQMKDASLIMEWKVTTVSELPYFWGLYVASVVAMVVGFIKRRPETKLWTPVVLVFAIWGSFFYRNAALLAFAAVPLLASTVRVKKAGWLVWFAALFLAFCDAHILKRPFPEAPMAWIRFPVGACQYVRDNNLQGKMFNTYDIGGYIGWALGPERKVFMDGRYIFYPLLKEFDARQVDPTYLTEKGIDYAIVQNGHEFLFPSSKWTQVYRDEAALVFIKK